ATHGGRQGRTELDSFPARHLSAATLPTGPRSAARRTEEGTAARNADWTILEAVRKAQSWFTKQDQKHGSGESVRHLPVGGDVPPELDALYPSPVHRFPFFVRLCRKSPDEG